MNPKLNEFCFANDYLLQIQRDSNLEKSAIMSVTNFANSHAGKQT